MKRLWSILASLAFASVVATATAQTPPGKAVAAPPAKAVVVKAKPEGITFLPLAKKGQIPNPSVLADRIDESLRADPTGNRRARGANVTPNDLLTAVQQAGGTVVVLGVDVLPEYLRSLGSREMPEGNLLMSRVVVRKHQSGKITYALDLDKGHARMAHKGEVGWYDMNTGNLILAGDCSNTPITPTVGPLNPPAPQAQAGKPAAAVAGPPAKPAANAVVPVMPLDELPKFIGCYSGCEVTPKK